MQFKVCNKLFLLDSLKKCHAGWWLHFHALGWVEASCRDRLPWNWRDQKACAGVIARMGWQQPADLQNAPGFEVSLEISSMQKVFTSDGKRKHWALLDFKILLARRHSTVPQLGLQAASHERASWFGVRIEKVSQSDAMMLQWTHLHVNNLFRQNFVNGLSCKPFQIYFRTSKTRPSGPTHNFLSSMRVQSVSSCKPRDAKSSRDCLRRPNGRRRKPDQRLCARGRLKWHWSSLFDTFYSTWSIQDWKKFGGLSVGMNSDTLKK